MIFLKPKDQKRQPKSAVKVFRDGREVCSDTAAGRAEYKRRVTIMWMRQLGKCFLCSKPISVYQATFEHEDGRGMGAGKRDDRIWKDNSPYNGAACGTCQTLKGSMSLTKWMEWKSYERL